MKKWGNEKSAKDKTEWNGSKNEWKKKWIFVQNLYPAYLFGYKNTPYTLSIQRAHTVICRYIILFINLKSIDVDVVHAKDSQNYKNIL